MALKEKDFIEIEYTGKTSDGIIFDTTDKKVAQEHELYNDKVDYGPVVICLGEGQILPGLDKKLVGKDVGKHSISLTAEEGFGKRDAKYIQLVSTAKFTKQGIKPMPGLQINIDGMVGLVKTVSGGRTIVDFNNPLSGRDISYELKVNKIVDDLKTQLESLMSFSFRLAKPEMKIEGDKVTLIFEQELPKEAQELVSKKIIEVTKIKKVEFGSKKKAEVVKKEEKKKD
tara:strand:- start:359 stop:1042 length:684 start_codon:yes stop_codon:yes gene_type:complete